MLRPGGLIVAFALTFTALPAMPATPAAASQPVAAAFPDVSAAPGPAASASGIPVTPSKGTPWAWGWGSSGQLGNDATAQQNAPVRTQLLGTSALAAGDGHSLGAKNDKTFWAWGENSDGQLCDGTIIDRLVPTQTSLSDVTGIGAGAFHTLAVKGDGSVWACGDNTQGQLGNGSMGTDVPNPAQVSGVGDVVAVAGGRFFSVALKSDGTVWTWGDNWNGQLGDGTTTQRSTPGQVLGAGGTGFLTGIDAIAAGNNHVLARKTDGTVYAWGTNSMGQLGDGTTTQSAVPVQVTGFADAVSLAAGANHSLAAKSDGTAWAWGFNGNGQLGDGTAGLQWNTVPTQVLGAGGSGNLGGVRSVGGSNGGNHSQAVKTDGTLWSWGFNGNGQLGDGTTTDSNVPVQVSGLSGASQIAGGRVFTLANQSPKVEPVPAGTDRNRPLLNGATAGIGVATATGTFTTSRTDLAIAGRGPAPAFSRSYNSNDTRVGALGPGWTHSYARGLSDPGGATPDLTLVGPLGRSDRYTAAADEYAPPVAVQVSLTRNDDGTYSASYKDQSSATFDGAGRLTSLSDRYGNVSTLTYDATGRLATVSDPAGRGSLSFAYHPSGRLASLTDWSGRSVEYGYDLDDRLETVTDREGGVTTYGYDAQGRLSTIRDPLDNVAVTTTYNADGTVATQKDARGLTSGETISFSYADNGDGTYTTTTSYPPASFGAWSSTVADTYDADTGWLQGRTTRPSTSETYTTSYLYDLDGNPRTITDARGNTSELCYDADYAGVAVPGSEGNLTRTISPAPTGGTDPVVTVRKYDAKNNLVQEFSPKGIANGATVTCATDLSASLNAAYATDLVYDASGITLVAVTRPFTDPDLGAKIATTKFEYADGSNPGMVTKIVPPRGNTTGTPDYTYATSLAYNQSGSQAGMLLSSTDALGNKVTFNYDSIGRLLSSVDPIGNQVGGTPTDYRTNYVYDDEDRATFIKLPAPAAGGAQLVSEARYDLAGNRTVAIDANGQVTKYLFDERNLVVEVQESPSAWTNPLSTPSPLYRTTYAYDGLGSLTRITRAAGDATNERVLDMTYDGAGRQRTEKQYPSWPSTSGALTTTTSYDGNGNPTSVVDPLGRETAVAYDAIDRASGITYVGGGAPNVSYLYDANGNRTSMVDGTGTTSYAYDELDRVLSVTTPGPKTVQYRYDLDSNRRKMTYPDGTAVTYTVDKGQRTTTLAESTRTTSYAYRADGSVQSASFPNGTTTSYAYDNARRTTAVSSAQGIRAISDHRYVMDAVGNRTRADEALLQPGAAPPSAFGDNASGQLGNNSTTDRSSPVAITAFGTPKLLVAGGLHSLALMPDGTVKAWGENADGQIGNNSSTDRKTPLAVSGITTATAIGAGGGHSLAVLGDGTVRAWGRNANGQLGNGGTALSRVPVTVSGLGSVSAVSGGTAHSLALKTDGSVWAWGLRTNGRIGVGVATGNQTTPIEVTGLSDVSAVAAGGAHSLGLKSDGTVWSWGLNLSGQLGDGSTTERLTPVQVKDPTGVGYLSGIVEIAAGGDHSLALKADGTVWAWGSNVSGQIGDNASGSLNNRPLPVQVKGPLGVGFLTEVRGIEAGQSHSVAVKTTGSAWAWGLGTDGRLGNGSTSQQNAPVQSGTLALLTQVTAGDKHTLVQATAVERRQYGYDRIYRLTTENADSYGYDPVGNRASSTVRGVSSTYGYDKADRITTAGGTSYAVNDAGNVAARGSDSFGYDQANRLTSASVAAGSTSYTYDGDGVRVSRTTSAGTTSYVHDRAMGLPVVIDDGTRRYIYGPTGLAYSLEGTTLTVHHADALQSSRALSDSGAASTQRYGRDAWGMSTVTQGTSTQPFGFTGELNDDTTGLLHLRARDYDPATGRFMQRDTTLNGGGGASVSLNQYAYAGSNPVSARDPSGRAVSAGDGGGACVDPACVGNSAGGYVPHNTTTTTLAAQYGVTLAGTATSANETAAPIQATQTDRAGVAPGASRSSSLGAALPDYVSITVNVAPTLPVVGTLFGWSGNVTVDRYGQIYARGLGATAGKALMRGSGSVTAGYVLQPTVPDKAALSSFLSGYAFSLGGGYWAGAQATWSPFASGTQQAVEIGAFTPQFGVSGGYSGGPWSR